jgi:hypothetical protein
VDLRRRLHDRFFRTPHRRAASVVATVIAVVGAPLAIGFVSAGAATTNGDQIDWADTQCIATAFGQPIVQAQDVVVQTVVPNTVATSAAYDATIPGGTATLPSSGGGFAITGFKDVGQTYLFRSSSGSPQITGATANGGATNNGNPVPFNIITTNEGASTSISSSSYTQGNGGVSTYTTSAAHNLSVNQLIDITGFNRPLWNVSGYLVASVPSATQFTIKGLPYKISSASWNAGVWTYHTSARLSAQVGDTVNISGAVPSRYNGNKTIASVPDDHTFTSTTSPGTTDPGPMTVLGTMNTLPDPGGQGTTLGAVKTLTTVRLNTPTASPGPLTTPDVTINMTAPAANSTVTTYGAAVAVTATLTGPGDTPTQCIVPHADPQTDGISATVVGTGGPTTTSYPACRPPSVCATTTTTLPPAPAITSVAPTSGSTAGGTSVTITGTDLTGATAVNFGATAASTFTVDSATQITATAPAHAAGTVDITATTPGGTSATGAGDQYTYVAGPTVTSVTPTSGPTAGGTSVTIAGTGFTGATAVDFGATAATSFTVDNANQITATAPAHAAGTVDVTVTAPAGTSPTSVADQYTYAAAPTVTSVTPSSGPTAGGTSVTIAGTGFTGATAVDFGGTAATSFTVDNANQITATVPAHAAGTVDVTVTTVGGTSSTGAGDQYSYVAAPTVTAVSPALGPTSGGTSVTITGTNFTGATAVSFGATPAASFTVDNAGQISATTPAHAAGVVDVTVTTAGGTSATGAADQFGYVGAPSVTSVTPSSGPTAGGTSVTIAGSGFTGASAVNFGATAATSFTVDNANQITATAPAQAAGSVHVTVTTAGGTSSTGAGDQYTYVASPTVTNVSPNSGSTAGGTSVTITGTGFTGASAVSFGGTAATSFTVDNATQITATAPAHAAGTVDVTVTTVGGTSATGAADQYTFATPPSPPTVTGLSPTSGPTTGGTSVTITGTNFTGVSAVDFGGTAATSFTVDSATQITATAPAHAAGTVDVTVTAAGGTSAIAAADQYTYTGVASACGTSCITVGDRTMLETDGNPPTHPLQFPVTLSEPATQQVTVHYTVVGGTATGGTKAGTGADYKIKSGTIVFKPSAKTGITPISKTIAISAFGDTASEPDETFSVILDSPTGGPIVGPGTGTGACGSTPGCATGTIVNDDGITSDFTLGVGDGSIFSARSGKQNLKLPVTLSGKAATTVTVQYTVVPGSATFSKKATEGGDYGGKTAGTLTFAPGQTSKMISAPIYPDASPEADQSYTVVLSNVNGNGTGVTVIRVTGTGTILGLH